MTSVVVAVCSVALIGVTTSASARPSRSQAEQASSTRAGAPVQEVYMTDDGRYLPVTANVPEIANKVAVGTTRADRRASRRQRVASNAPATGSFGMFGGSSVVAEARRYIGTNPTGRGHLWCARFMNMVLERTGHQTTGSDMARSFTSYGRRISGPQIGAIAVFARGARGGHVGVVSAIDEDGNPVIISGNHGHRVAEATYPRGHAIAYVMPN